MLTWDCGINLEIKRLRNANVSGQERDPEIGWLKEATKSIRITIYASTEYRFRLKEHALIKSVTEDPGGIGEKSNQRIASLEHLQ
jgi:hypothetical protein